MYVNWITSKQSCGVRYNHGAGAPLTNTRSWVQLWALVVLPHLLSCGALVVLRYHLPCGACCHVRASFSILIYIWPPAPLGSDMLLLLPHSAALYAKILPLWWPVFITRTERCGCQPTNGIPFETGWSLNVFCATHLTDAPSVLQGSRRCWPKT